jgi:hypothetical protein
MALLEILLEAERGRRIELEGRVAAARLALGARERVFLFGLGMQKHREVLADLHVAEIAHLGRAAADDDPVALAHGQPEQLVANRAAHLVDVHASIIP